MGGEDMIFSGPGQRLGPAIDAQLGIYVIRMPFHRAGGEEELVGDIPVGEAGIYKTQYILLAGTKGIGLGSG